MEAGASAADPEPTSLIAATLFTSMNLLVVHIWVRRGAAFVVSIFYVIICACNWAGTVYDGFSDDRHFPVPPKTLDSILRLAHIRRTMPHSVHLLLAVTVVFLSGCDTGKVSLSDPQLAPMLKAIAAVDRAALGLTPIPTNAEVHLYSRSDARYDAMLIIFDTPALYAGVHRNIEFRKTATGYKWLREFETHPGPMTFKQLGNTDHQLHTAHEEISIIYDTTGISGVTPNKLHVYYHGPDSRIVSGKDLSLDNVRPFLAEWSQKR